MAISKQAVTELKDKRFLVLGLGRSGKAAAKVLSNLGLHVTVYEEKKKDQTSAAAAELAALGVKVHFKESAEGGMAPAYAALLKHVDVVIPSPGIPDTNPLITDAVSKGLPIWSEIELAYLLAAEPTVVAITGTNGKTTTTELITAILEAADLPVIAAGNIGHPFVQAVSEAPKGTIYCVEVSSFQLAHIERFKPHVALLLNITEDHLNWHRNMDEYIAAKTNIFKNQTSADLAVLNDGCEICQRQDHGKARKLTFSAAGIRGEDLSAFATYETNLLGRHNRENVNAAIAAVSRFGVSAEVVRRAVHDFKPSEHRLEPVSAIENIVFINDSKSTNPDSTVRAIEAMDKMFVLIAGGRNKGNSFEPIRHLISSSDRVKGLFKGAVLIGESAYELSSMLSGLGMVAKAESLPTAVSLAFDLALNLKEGGAWDTAASSRTQVSGESEAVQAADLPMLSSAKAYVLFSPGCASFDMFSSYEDRGHKFKQAVSRLSDRVEKGKVRKAEIKAAQEAARAAAERGRQN